MLLFAAPLTPGRRTIANLIRTAGFLAEAHPSTYQRVLSQAHWSGLRLAALLTRFLLCHFWPDGVVLLAGDDTVDGHKGERVYGKARNRDAVRPIDNTLIESVLGQSSQRPACPKPTSSPVNDYRRGYPQFPLIWTLVSEAPAEKNEVSTRSG